MFSASSALELALRLQGTDADGAQAAPDRQPRRDKQRPPRSYAAVDNESYGFLVPDNPPDTYRGPLLSVREGSVTDEEAKVLRERIPREVAAELLRANLRAQAEMELWLCCVRARYEALKVALARASMFEDRLRASLGRSTSLGAYPNEQLPSYLASWTTHVATSERIGKNADTIEIERKTGKKHQVTLALWRSNEIKALEHGVLVALRAKRMREAMDSQLSAPASAASAANLPQSAKEIRSLAIHMTIEETLSLDWEMIANTFARRHSPAACRGKWFELRSRELYSRAPFTAAEKRLTKEYIANTPTEQISMDKLSDLLGNRRSILRVIRLYAQTLRAEKRPEWTKEEETRLRTAMNRFGDNWTQIEGFVGTKTAAECLVHSRWMQSNLRRGRWTVRENAILTLLGCHFKREFGGLQLPWRQISRIFKTRQESQCRERFDNILDPDLDHSPFTEEEDAKIMEMYDAFGPKWAKMKAELRHRSEAAIMRRCRSLNGPPKRRYEVSPIEDRVLKVVWQGEAEAGAPAARGGDGTSRAQRSRDSTGGTPLNARANDATRDGGNQSTAETPLCDAVVVERAESAANGNGGQEALAPERRSRAKRSAEKESTKKRSARKQRSAA